MSETWRDLMHMFVLIQRHIVSLTNWNFKILLELCNSNSLQKVTSLRDICRILPIFAGHVNARKV